MRKTVLTFFFTAVFGMTMAQSLKTYSVYDTNQSGDITVSDVTNVVESVKSGVSPASTQQYVTAEDLRQLLTTTMEELNSVKKRLAALEIKEGLAKPDPNDVRFEDININGNIYHLGVSGAIDLGIGVRWAAYNVGAQAPYEYGNYYSWGEIQEKIGYFENSSFNEGFVDVARHKWGNRWRMPSKREFEILMQECSWIWSEYMGVKGCYVVGPNGNAIFLPAAGFCYESENRDYGIRCYYWSSTSAGSDYAYAYAYDLVYPKSTTALSKSRSFTGDTVRPIH